MKRAILMAVLLAAAVAVPAAADWTDDAEWLTARQGDLAKIVTEAVDDPGRARVRIGVLLSSVLEFTPSDACMWPGWALAVVSMTTFDQTMGYFEEGLGGDAVAIQRASALSGLTADLLTDFDTTSLVIDCI